MVWETIQVTSNPDVDELRHWTKAVVFNRLFLHQSGENATIWEMDTTTVPGSISSVERTLVLDGTPLADVGGIFNAGPARLGSWDTEGSIKWGAAEDNDTTIFDCKPDLEKLSNAVIPDALRGRIVTIIGTAQGFIVYSTSNILRARQINANEQFRIDELSNNLGVFSPFHVTVAADGMHRVWSNGAFYVINAKGAPGIPDIRVFEPAVGDYVKRAKGPPRLSHHNNRYFAIWLAEPEQGEGFNTTRRITEPGPRWFIPGWEQDFKYELGADSITLTRESLELPGEYIPAKEILTPKECEDTFRPDVPPVPPNVEWITEPQPGDPRTEFPFADPCEYVLWGTYLRRRPSFILEYRDFTGLSYTSEVHGQSLYISLNEQANFPRVLLSDLTVAEYRALGTPPYNAFNPWSSEPAFSFSALTLMMMLYRKAIKECDSNDNNAREYPDGTISRGFITNLHLILESASSIDVIVDATAVAAVSGGSVKTQVEEIKWGPEEIPAYRMTNTLVEYGPSGTTIKTFWRIVKKEPEWFDTELGVPTQTLSGITYPSLYGWDYIAGTAYDIRQDETNLQWNFALNAATEEFFGAHYVTRLAEDYPVSNDTITEHWATRRTLYGQTDYCTYAYMSSFAASRAYAELPTETIVSFSPTLLERENPEDSEATQYRRQYTANIEIAYSRTLYNPDATQSSPKGYSDVQSTVPMQWRARIARLAQILPSDTISGDPQAYLPQYLELARFRYPTQRLESAIVQVYADEGWNVIYGQTVNFPTPSLPRDEYPPEIWNGAENAGVIGEDAQWGTICGEDFLEFFPAVNVPDEFVPEWSTTEYVPAISHSVRNVLEDFEYQYPEITTLRGTVGQGIAYGIYSTVLLYDEHLDKWGVCSEPVRIFFDYRPINARGYDEGSDTLISEFTYNNRLSSLGGVLKSGAVVLWDDFPEMAYVLLGKLGLSHRNWTQLIEVETEFDRQPDALLVIEGSLDGRLVDPRMVKMVRMYKYGGRTPITMEARYFNIGVIGGRFHLVGLTITGNERGDL